MQDELSEELLAIVINRLRSLQTGNLTCRENGIALDHLEQALDWLTRRTLRGADERV